MNRMHPVAQFLDAVAAGGRPAREDLDEVVEASLRSDLSADGTQERMLRSKLRQAVAQILEKHDEGESGAARTLAREYAEELGGRLPEHVPSRHNVSAREVVDSIPRVG